MQGTRVLFVESDRAVCGAVEPILAAEGVRVERACSGCQALDALSGDPYDLILVDMALPDMDGCEIVAAQRVHSDVPIIVLSAGDREADKILALDSGADDFVTTPLRNGEFLARFRAALRRRALFRPDDNCLHFTGLTIDLMRRRAVVHGEAVELRPKEHSLLCALGAAPGVVTHRQVIDIVWGRESAVDAQFVRVLVGQLRQKLEVDPARPQFILTERGIGYRLGVSRS